MREEYRQRGVFDARGEWTWSQWCCCLSDLTEEKDGEKDEMKGGRERERETGRVLGRGQAESTWPRDSATETTRHYIW